jgi:hypothetical protein
MLVFTILSYSYFDLKKDFKEFTRSTDEKVERIYRDVQDIRIGTESIKGDIKLILDRQSRDNPIYPAPYQDIDPIDPPPVLREGFLFGPYENDVTYNGDNR